MVNTLLLNAKEPLTHIAARYRQFRREEEQHCRERDIGESDLRYTISELHGSAYIVSYHIYDPPDGIGEDEYPLGKHLPSSDAVDCDGYAIRNTKENHRGGDNSVESTGSVSNFSLNDFITYLVEPRKMRPKITTSAQFRYKAFSGTFSFLWTFEKKNDAGRPPSLHSLMVNKILASRRTWQKHKSFEYLSP